MDILSSLQLIGLFLVKVGVIAAIFYTPMMVGAKMLPRIDDFGFFLTPSVWALNLFCGAVLGGTLLTFNVDPEYFTVDSIFRTDGPWRLTFSDFLRDRINPFNYHIQAVVDQMRPYDQDLNLTVLLVAAAIAFGLVAFMALGTWRSFAAWRGIAFSAGVVIWAAYATIFAVSLLLWVLNILNFWTLAILTVVIHLNRSGTFPFHFGVLLNPVIRATGLEPPSYGGHGHGDHGGHGGGHGGHGGGHGGHHGGHGAHGGGHGDHGHGHDAHHEAEHGVDHGHHAAADHGHGAHGHSAAADGTKTPHHNSAAAVHAAAAQAAAGHGAKHGASTPIAHIPVGHGGPSKGHH
ncbi:membrane hypothetical protein [Azospirillaceae bacterium]